MAIWSEVLDSLAVPMAKVKDMEYRLIQIAELSEWAERWWRERAEDLRGSAEKERAKGNYDAAFEREMQAITLEQCAQRMSEIKKYAKCDDLALQDGTCATTVHLHFSTRTAVQPKEVFNDVPPLR